MARLPGGSGGGSNDDDSDDLDEMPDPTEELREAQQSPTSGGGRQTRDRQPRRSRRERRQERRRERRSETQSTGIATPEQTPEPAPETDPTEELRERQESPTSGGGRQTESVDQQQERQQRDIDRAADDATAELRERQEAPTSGGGRQGTAQTEVDRETQRTVTVVDSAVIDPALRAARRTPEGGLTREQREAVDREVAGVRGAVRAARETPTGGVDPIAELNAVTDALDEASATTRPATTAEFGADIEGFDESGSGRFDLPGPAGTAQEEAQEEFDRITGLSSDDLAQQAEQRRRDVLDVLGIDEGTAAGGLAGAAAVGVAAPEPVSTAGGAVILGGLVVGSIAVDVARREGITPPVDGDLFGSEGSTPSGDADPVSRTTLELPASGEFFTPEQSVEDFDRSMSEIPTPERAPGTSPGEIGVPELAASRFEQVQRQRQRRERVRDRNQGIFREGADEQELEEILRGPEDDVMIGEETPPSERVADETPREFEVPRDTDPRVVEPEEPATTDEPAARMREAQQSSFEAETQAIGQTPAERLLLGQDSVTGAGLDARELNELNELQAPRTATAIQTAQAADLVTPTAPRFGPEVADPSLLGEPTGPGFGFPNVFVDEPGFGVPAPSVLDPQPRPPRLPSLDDKRRDDDIEELASVVDLGVFENPVRSPEEQFAQLFGAGGNR